MAKKISPPSDTELIASLVAQKISAGLSPADALEVATLQLAHDKEAASRDAEEKALLADRLSAQADALRKAADEAASVAADAKATSSAAE
jgi:hypothetical protein